MNLRKLLSEKLLMSCRAVAPAVLALLVVQPSARAQVGTQADVPVTLQGRLHVQFNTTSSNASDVPTAQFDVRRARLGVVFSAGPIASAFVAPEFGEGEVRLIDAYLRLTFSSAVSILFGQFKRPFDLFVLESSNRSLVIERVGSIRGVDDCTGVGGVCSLPRLTEQLEFSNRDIGINGQGFIKLGKLRYHVAVTNGAGENTADVNDALSYYGRLDYFTGGKIRVGGYAGAHDFENEVTGDRNDYALAGGVDFEWGVYSDGVHVQVGFVMGQNWQSLDGAGDPSNFHTFEGIVAYRTPNRADKPVSSLQPVLRVSWSDPATNIDGDAGILFTPGFIFNLQRLNRIAMNVDLWAPSEGRAEWSLKIQSYSVF